MRRSDSPPKLDAEACKANMDARFKALQKALQNPKSVPTELLKACESQSALAAFSFPEWGIGPLARNTMYKYADLVLAQEPVPEGERQGESGRYYLDWLRKSVRMRARRERSSRTKAAKANRSNQRKQDKKNAIAEVERCSLVLSKAYLHLLQSLLGLARSQDIETETRQRLFNVINDQHSLYGHLFVEDLHSEGSSVEIFPR